MRDYIGDGDLPVNPAIDLSQFEPIAERLVKIAKGHGGKFVVAGYGEHPETDAALPAINLHIPNEGEPEHIIADLVKAAQSLAHVPGRNLYVMPAIVGESLGHNLKGGEVDVIGVLGAVPEFDAKHDPASRHDRLPLHPHAEVETSPGNFQPWYFFDRPYSVAEVKPVLIALAAQAGCDPVSKDASHVFRVPGTLNWPSKHKREDLKRAPEPVMARLVTVPYEPIDSVTLDELKAAMEAKWGQEASAEEPGDFDWNQCEGNANSRLNEGTIQRHLHACDEGTDRSSRAFAFMKLAKRCSHSPEEIVAMFFRYPHAPIVQHYKDEAHIRADVVRAFTKKDKHPSRDAGANKVFQLQEGAPTVPVRAVRIIGGNMPGTIDQAEQGLLEQGTDIYQRGSMIVRPALNEEITAAKGRTTRGMRLVPVKVAGMREHMTAAADFRHYSVQAKDWRSINCPKELAEAYLEREGQWKLRRLSGTINAPTLRPDGSILETPGYDEATGIYYHPGAEKFPPVPRRPSRKQAEESLELLKGLLGEFPFTSDASRAVALSGLLTSIVRRSLPTAPMHGISAPVPSSGKSFLVDLCSLLATGHLAPVIAQGTDEAELEKRLGAALMAGDQILSFDNCDRPLEGSFLCQVLTQTLVKPRILGKSKVPEVPTNAAMFATGNNLTVAGDMTRRVLRGEIDPGIERPELRKFAHEPAALLQENRARYVVAALTILRAWVVARRPAFPGRPAPLGSFREWSELVRDALCWLGEADPCTTIEASRSDDPQLTPLVVLLNAWSTAIGERRVTTKEVIAAAIGAKKGVALADALGAVAASFTKGSDKFDAMRLGKYLSKNAGRVVDGLVLIKDALSHGNQLWRLEHRF